MKNQLGDVMVQTDLGGGKPFDLPKSIPYVMKTKKERKEVTILIKNLNEIPERLSRQSK